jgi:adenine-specific DNA-methyltransferase
MTISKRDLLATLSKPELLDIGRWVEVEVTGKMSKEDLLDRLAPSDRADLSKILPRLAYESLKASCKDLGLPVDGREKSVFVARLLAAATPIGKPVPQAAPRAPDDFTLELEVQPRKPRLAWQGMDRKEAVVSVPTQVVEIVRPGKARDHGDSLLKTDVKTTTRAVGEKESKALPPNRLIWTNDNLVALQTLLDERDPETREYRYRGKVDLIYIDPPFMVNSDFRTDNTIEIEIDEDEGVQAKKEPSLVEHLAYRDTWRQGLDSFLGMLRRRLELLKDLLAPTGSIYVHLDWHAVHYVKVLMDELFGYENLLNEIVWKRTSARGDSKGFNLIHDTILCYGMSASAFLRSVNGPFTSEYVRSHYGQVDPKNGKRYTLVSMRSPNPRPNLMYEWKGYKPHANGWAYSRETMAEFDKQGLIYYPAGGPGKGQLRLRRYLDDDGLPLSALWVDIPAVNSQAVERNGYPTQKPVELLERILAASCPPGGLVLDCFMGSGTTCEASEKMGRRWIGIDNGKYAVHLARKRLIQLHDQITPPPPPDGSIQYDYIECTTCKNIERKEKPRKSRTTFQVRPFTVENMGVYQRAETWQDFQSQKSKYRDEMIKVFGGEPTGVGQYLHGRKGDQWVHVGPLDGAISVAQIWSIAREAARTDTKAVTVLSADFDTLSAGDKDAIKQKTGVHITIRIIPVSAIDEVRRRIEMMRVGGERAVESMAIPAFYAPLSIVLDVKTTGRMATVTLERCEIDITSFLQSQRPALKAITEGMSATARKKAEAERDKWAAREKDLKKWLAKADTWQKFIDFWAIDWDYGHRAGTDDRPIFESGWQSFRLRKAKGEVEALTFSAENLYKEPGGYLIAARVTDVFGNDGIATVACEVG